MSDDHAAFLATPEQLAAETMLSALLKNSDLLAVQARLRAELSESQRGRTPDGAATLDRAIALWTNSGILSIISEQSGPNLYWVSDNTPRAWFGHDFAGFGVCGDNPDFINRSANLHANCRYEIVGQLAAPPLRTAQWVLEVSRVASTTFSKNKLSKNQADMGNQISMMTDLDLDLSASGEFRIPIDTSEPSSLLFRDVRSDWAQLPSRLTVRQIEGSRSSPIGIADLLDQIPDKLENYIHFWAAYLETWFGGLAPNTISPTIDRDRGWGFMAGFHFDLTPDEVIILTKRDGGARYFGAQLIDPWMMTADARRYQNSLNPSQATPDEEGDVTTYVISPTDPGVANWLDTAGVHRGYGILRWQAVVAGASKEDVVVGFRVAKIAEVARLSGVARCSPGQRQARLAVRRAGYENRLV